MKLNGIFGKGSGKLGSSVFAVSGGVQIMREYNPNVSNPSTDRQVAQRAKLKLMSQLAAALAPVIAIKKDGLVSARNQFVSMNIGNATFENDEASILLEGLKLTKGTIALPALVADATPEGLDLSLADSAPSSVASILYIICKKNAQKQLQIVSTETVAVTTENPIAACDVTAGAGNYVVYAYGILKSATSGTAQYGNYEVEAAETDATLLTGTRFMLTNADVTATEGAEVTKAS